jgi:hypothetical protein
VCLWLEERSSLKWLFQGKLLDVVWCFYDSLASQTEPLCLRAMSCATGNGLLAPCERSDARLFTPHCNGLVVVGRLLLVSDLARVARRKCEVHCWVHQCRFLPLLHEDQTARSFLIGSFF